MFLYHPGYPHFQTKINVGQLSEKGDYLIGIDLLEWGVTSLGHKHFIAEPIALMGCEDKYMLYSAIYIKDRFKKEYYADNVTFSTPEELGLYFALHWAAHSQIYAEHKGPILVNNRIVEIPNEDIEIAKQADVYENFMDYLNTPLKKF